MLLSVMNLNTGTYKEPPLSIRVFDADIMDLVHGFVTNHFWSRRHLKLRRFPTANDFTFIKGILTYSHGSFDLFFTGGWTEILDDSNYVMNGRACESKKCEILEIYTEGMISNKKFRKHQ
jgi:hypothetical protein